jgi:hypothetical protein
MRDVTGVLTKRGFWSKAILLLIAAVVVPACGGGGSSRRGGGGAGTGGVNAVNDTMPAVDEDDNNVAIAIAILLSNDTGPVGANLQVTAVSPASANGGTVDITGPNVRYTPAPDFNGNDTFTYTVTDSVGGGTDTATVSVVVNPVPDSPIAVDDASPADFPNRLEDSGAVAVPVLANDSDPDGGALTIVAVTQGTSGGAVVITGGGTGLTYAPPANFAGQDSFTYTIEDADGNADTATVTLTVTGVNDDTHVAADDADTTDEDTPVTTDVLANDTVPTIDIPWTIAVTVQPANGTVVVGPGPTYLMTYIPNPDFNGADSYTYAITDSNGIADTAVVNITVAAIDDIPLAVDNCVLRSKGLGAIQINVLRNDRNFDLPLTDVLVSDGSHGTVTVGAGPNFFVIYTPTDANYTGVDRFMYTIEDANGDTAEAEVVVYVLDVATASSSLDPGRQFGSSVASLGINLTASSGPCHEFAVGAPGQGDDGMIFIVDGDDYSVLGSFAAPDWGGNGNQHFGAAMAVGNNRLYVGAPQWRSGNDHYGIVYLFNIAAGGVTYTGNTRTDWQRNSDFGAVLAARNGGVFVGVPYGQFNDNGYVRNLDTNLNDVGTINNPEPDNGDLFGAALAVGDFLGDGSQDLAVGAPGDANAGFNGVGTVYVFDGDSLGNFLAPDTAISHPTPAADDHFGAALARLQADGGGKDELVIGAPGTDSGATLDVGAAFIAEVDDAPDFISVANPSPSGNDQFGSVLVSLGNDEFLVGVPNADVTGFVDAGVVHCFSANGGLSFTYLNPTPAAGDLFGAALSTDTRPNILIGAPGADPSGTLDAGEVWAHTFCGKKVWAVSTIGNGPTNQRLWSFRTDATNVVVDGVFSVTGIEATDALLAIDFGTNGVLYALGVDTATSPDTIRLYSIDLSDLTGPSVPATRLTALAGTQVSYADPANWGMDYDPVNNVLRVVSSALDNISITTAGVVTNQGTLGYATGDTHEADTPGLNAIAFTNNFPGALTTRAVVWDNNNGGVQGTLTVPNSAGAVVTVVDSLGSGSALLGFDVCGAGVTYAHSGNLFIQDIDLTDGSFGPVTAISGSGFTTYDIAIEP